MTDRGTYDKHIVSFTEILEVFEGARLFFENSSGQRAPLVLVDPTSEERYLTIPIEPTGKQGIWSPVTSFHLQTRTTLHGIGRREMKMRNKDEEYELGRNVTHLATSGNRKSTSVVSGRLTGDEIKKLESIGRYGDKTVSQVIRDSYCRLSSSATGDGGRVVEWHDGCGRGYGGGQWQRPV